MIPAQVSVIIPAINEAERVGRAVASAWAAGAGEVLVVDGGSRDETVSLAEAAGAEVLQSPAGRATQQNAGARQSRGEVLLFLHADNWLGPECLVQSVAALDAQPKRWGGAFRQQIDSRRPLFRLIAWGDGLRVTCRGVPFGDQAIFLRREVFEQVGGFPEEPLMEDLMLAVRLRQLAWPLLLPGPVHVDPRRWQQRGPVRQTCRNLILQWRHARGATPQQLAAEYPRHDQTPRPQETQTPASPAQSE
jgi:rSAM/selenodomain-associated transferase 2